MRLLLALLLTTSIHAAEPAPIDFAAKDAGRFANLALTCVHKEYPNKISHVMQSDADAATPRMLTPAFYGCYDWHSSVHGHWLLARLARQYPKASFAAPARAALAQSITTANIELEVAYLRGAGRASFERPYGLAWLLQLAAELRETNDPLYDVIKPLEDATAEQLMTWLPKLSYPVRSGEHSQTAFALGLILDSAPAQLRQLAKERALAFYRNDRNCPLAYEPSGEDFLSPCLAEADLMRRVLPKAEFATWLRGFMPKMTLTPAVVTDPTDPKLAHLDGLNLSRAWMLEGIASAAPSKSLSESARAHRAAGLASVTGKHYEGGHWLGSFAVYLVTKRGL